MRNILRATGFAGSMMLSATSADAAAVLNTGTLLNGLAGSSHYYCTATNVSTKEAGAVTVEVISTVNGTVLASVQALTLAPSHSLDVTTPDAAPAFCRVSGLSKKNGTVVFLVYNSATLEELTTVTAP